LSNGVLLVARAGVPPSHALTLAREHLEQAGAAAVGVVLNDIDFRRDATYDVAFTQFKDYAAYYHEAGRPSDD
jgi:Mrp family chromosome partitioning ATPase